MNLLPSRKLHGKSGFCSWTIGQRFEEVQGKTLSRLSWTLSRDSIDSRLSLDFPEHCPEIPWTPGFPWTFLDIVQRFHGLQAFPGLTWTFSRDSKDSRLYFDFPGHCPEIPWTPGYPWTSLDIVQSFHGLLKLMGTRTINRQAHVVVSSIC